MFRPLRTAVPRHTRSISLLDNVKKILGRGTPPPPTPVAAEEVKIEKVGGAVSTAEKRQNKVIGFDVSVPRKLTGTELFGAVRASVETIAKQESLSEETRLQLARTIRERTGHLVPDAVLNVANPDGREIVQYFERLDRRGGNRYPVLTLDEASLPRNVRVGR